MITINWLIEKDINVNSNKLKQVLSNSEYDVKYTILDSYSYKDKLEYYSKEDCVISVGSIDFIRNIKSHTPWIPGYYANFTNFNCMDYYPYFHEYLLNRDYIILPLGAINDNYKYDQLMNRIFERRLFIRPCNGYKSFIGQELNWNNFNDISLYGKPETPVVISQYKEISHEYRFFCDAHKVITGSYYSHPDQENNSNIQEYYNEALNYANNILKETTWRPDKIFSMDIGFSDYMSSKLNPYLIELNSFSCSGWYDSDISLLVKSVNELAIQDYLDLNS